MSRQWKALWSRNHHFGCCFVNVCFIFPVPFSSEGEHCRSSFLTFAALCRLTFKVPAYAPYSYSVRQRPRQCEVCIDCSHFKPPVWSPNIRLVFCVLYNACWNRILHIAFIYFWPLNLFETLHRGSGQAFNYTICTAAASDCPTKGGNFGNRVEGLVWEFNTGSLQDRMITRYV